MGDIKINYRQTFHLFFIFIFLLYLTFFMFLLAQIQYKNKNFTSHSNLHYLMMMQRRIINDKQPFIGWVMVHKFLAIGLYQAKIYGHFNQSWLHRGLQSKICHQTQWKVVCHFVFFSFTVIQLHVPMQHFTEVNFLSHHDDFQHKLHKIELIKI